MTVEVLAITMIAGLMIGSFLTVVAERVPRGESVVAPGSRCGSCGLRLGPLDLVSVFSWLEVPPLSYKYRHRTART
jgi:leader peptidase (prepilin peptidase) / N-methyltransferase